MKHLVCACTGLPRQDLEWLFEYSEATPASALELLGTMQPTSKFGEVFQYSNLMAAAAGFVGGSLAVPGKELGAAYDEAMRDEGLRPLGMKHTTFDFARALKGNVAQPHGDDVDGKPARARMDLNESIVPVRPAGGVWTSAHDLAPLREMELAKGTLPNGKRLVSEENLLARRAPQVLVSEDITYGMGLFVDKRWGIPVVHHGGDLAGLPQRHDLAARARRRRRHPDERGLRRRSCAGPSCASSSRCSSTASPRPTSSSRPPRRQRKAAIAKERERLVVPADSGRGRQARAALRRARRSAS